jgi:hypothetical protein
VVVVVVLLVVARGLPLSEGAVGRELLVANEEVEDAVGSIMDPAPPLAKLLVKSVTEAVDGNMDDEEAERLATGLLPEARGREEVEGAVGEVST